jgi:hypothetical protein
MSSESASTRGSKDGGFFNLAGKLDPLSSPLDYIKRFFYQILGIYFPPVILMLYLVLFWGNQQYLYSLDYGHIHGDVLVSPENNLKSLFVYAKTHDSIIQLILLVIVVAVTGEAINSVTSKVAKISPIKRTNYFKKLNTKLGILRHPLGYPLSDPARLADWPIWINVTRFPVNFAHFDRYYVSVLEQDKRTLAGKIGWLSFYRNMTAISSVIFALQFYSLYQFHTHGVHILEKFVYEYYVLIIALVSILMFFLGHHAQVNANRATLWDAYRRNELRKNLEIRYGELSLSLGIKDEFKKKTIEYMVDRWFLAVEQSIQSLSSFLLTMVEEIYSFAGSKELDQDKESSVAHFADQFFRGNRQGRKLLSQYLEEIPDKDKQARQTIGKAEVDIKNLIIDSYKEWNIGGYAQVISNSLKALELSHIRLNQKAWQTIHGQYSLENSLRTDAAFMEVEDNVNKWGWTYETTQNKKKIDKDKIKGDDKSRYTHFTFSNYFGTKKDFDETANIISRSANPYRQNFDKIMEMLKELQMMRKLELHDFEKLIVRLSDDHKILSITVYDSSEAISEREVKVDGGDCIVVNNATELNVIINDMKWTLKINQEKEIINIDVNRSLGNIYRQFGATNYDEAGKLASKVLKELKVTRKLLENIHRDGSAKSAEKPTVGNNSLLWPW